MKIHLMITMVAYVKWALPQYFDDKWSFTQFEVYQIYPLVQHLIEN